MDEKHCCPRCLEWTWGTEFGEEEWSSLCNDCYKKDWLIGTIIGGVVILLLFVFIGVAHILGI